MITGLGGSLISDIVHDRVWDSCNQHQREIGVHLQPVQQCFGLIAGNGVLCSLSGVRESIDPILIIPGQLTSRMSMIQEFSRAIVGTS